MIKNRIKRRILINAGEITEEKNIRDLEKENSKKYHTMSVWDSDMKIIRKAVVRIPRHILQICNAIQTKLPGLEFSILVRGEWTESGFVLSEDYVIPKQRVAAASVDYNEDLGTYRNNGYNTVIHSHPFKSSSFSHSDEEAINSHFDCSILYSESNFTTASIRIQITPDMQLHIKPEIEIIDNIDIDIDISNIEIVPTITRVYPKYSEYDDLFTGGML